MNGQLTGLFKDQVTIFGVGVQRLRRSKLTCKRLISLIAALLFGPTCLSSAALAQDIQTFVVDGDTVTVNFDTGMVVGTGSIPFTAQVTSVSNRTPTTVTFSGSGTVNGTQGTFNNCTVNFVSVSFTGGCGPFLTLATASTVRAVTNTTTQSQVRTSTTLLSEHIRSTSADIASSRRAGRQSSAPPLPGQTGLSAGSEDMRWGVWADGSGSAIKNSSSIAASEGYSLAAIAGLDYNYMDQMVLGLNAGYLRSDVKVASLGGNRISSGPQVGPYASYIFNENFAGDASFTYAAPTNTTTSMGTRSSYDSDRYTGAVNLNAFANPSPDQRFSGFVGYVYSVEEPTTTAPQTVGGTPTTVRTGIFRLGGQLDAPIGNLNPYFPVLFQYNTTPTRDATGRAGLTIGAGLRYQLTDTVKTDFHVSNEFRKNSRNATIEANLRVVF